MDLWSLVKHDLSMGPMRMTHAQSAAVSARGGFQRVVAHPLTPMIALSLCGGSLALMRQESLGVFFLAAIAGYSLSGSV